MCSTCRVARSSETWRGFLEGRRAWSRCATAPLSSSTSSRSAHRQERGNCRCGGAWGSADSGSGFAVVGLGLYDRTTYVLDTFSQRAQAQEGDLQACGGGAGRLEAVSKYSVDCQISTVDAIVSDYCVDVILTLPSSSCRQVGISGSTSAVAWSQTLLFKVTHGTLTRRRPPLMTCLFVTGGACTD